MPVAFLLFTTYDPGGFFTFAPALLETTSILVLAGAILFLLSFLFYRRSFLALRKVDGGFTSAAVLCLVGSLGFLLVLVGAALVIGDSSSLLGCVNGHPSQALSCLRSSEPFGAYTGLIGFWLAWLGGVGIVLGLLRAGGRYRSGPITDGAVAYAILLLILVGPFLALVVFVPYTEYLLALAPFLTVAAPALVWSGSRRHFR